MNRLLWIAPGAVALFAAAFVLNAQVSAKDDGIGLLKTDPETLALGAVVYLDHCASCHGADLEGQPNWRVRDADGQLPAPPHDASGHTWHHDGETLFRLTKYGVGAMIGDPDYPSAMPIYDGVLSDGEIVAVLSYIKSTWPEEIRARHDALENRQ